MSRVYLNAFSTIVFLLSLTSLLLTGIYTPISPEASPSTYTPRCEIYGVVTRVVDGDTAWIRVMSTHQSPARFATGSVIKVRFADVNAPELSTPEGVESKNALIELIDRVGAEICLDVDNKRIFDPYDRVIAVVFLKYNETHWLNLNKWLIDNGYASIVDFRDNEFNPWSWRLFEILDVNPVNNETSNNSPGFPLSFFNIVMIILSVIIIVITALLVRKAFKASQEPPY